MLAARRHGRDLCGMHAPNQCPVCGTELTTFPCPSCGHVPRARIARWRIALWIVAAVLLLFEIGVLVWVAYRDWGWIGTR
jgi:hypothetical protein